MVTLKYQRLISLHETQYGYTTKSSIDIVGDNLLVKHHITRLIHGDVTSNAWISVWTATERE